MPPALAGREPIIRSFQVALKRLLLSKSPKSILPYGLRGVGKTVLLRKFIEDAQAQAYQVAMIEADDNVQFIPALADQLRKILFSLDESKHVFALAKRAMRIFKSFTVQAGLEGLSLTLGVDAEPGFADSGDMASDLTSLFVAIGEAAREQRTGILIAIDEVQYIQQSEFAALIKAIHQVNQQALPMIVVATGLPQILAISGEAKSYAERLFDFRMIGALDFDEAREAIVAPAAAEKVLFEEEAVRAIFEQTAGYPYFIQEWAYRAWNQAEGSTITVRDVHEGAALALPELDAGFFAVRYDRCTPTEKRYLRAMAELGKGPYRSLEVAKAQGKAQNRVAPYRDSLIKKGMIWSPQHGEIEFSVPLFDDFMRRREPNFDVES